MPYNTQATVLRTNSKMIVLSENIIEYWTLTTGAHGERRYKSEKKKKNIENSDRVVLFYEIFYEVKKRKHSVTFSIFPIFFSPLNAKATVVQSRHWSTRVFFFFYISLDEVKGDRGFNTGKFLNSRVRFSSRKIKSLPLPPPINRIVLFCAREHDPINLTSQIVAYNIYIYIK